MRSLGLGLGFNRHRILGGVVPLLDTYTGASAAYSLRNLSSSTTDVVRVRRSSNDDEQDFTASEVSGGALATFVGAGNDGFVTTWYDQVPVEETTGTELVTQFDGVANGTDVTTLTNWSAYNTAISRNVVNEALEIVASGGNQGAIYTATTTIGNKYLFTCDVSGDLGAGALYFPQTSLGAKNVSSAGGSVRFFFEASSTSSGIFFRANSNGAGTTTYSNISLKEVNRIPNDATRTSASAQPKIVDSGSLITKGSFPAITFGTGDTLIGTDITPSYHYSFFSGFFDNLGTLNDLYTCGGNPQRLSVGMPTSGKMGLKTFDTNNNFEIGNASVRITNDTKHLVTTRFENVASGDANIYVDSVDDSSGSGYTRIVTGLRLGSFSNRPVCASFYELIVYNTDQSSNQSGIEADITSHYSI